MQGEIRQKRGKFGAKWSKGQKTTLLYEKEVKVEKRITQTQKLKKKKKVPELSLVVLGACSSM